MQIFNLLYFVLTKGTIGSVSEYSVALYPKVKAPITVSTKLITPMICLFIVFTEKIIA